MQLDPQDILFSNLSVVDDIGRVFFYQNQVFRAIYPASVGAVRQVLDSGLIEKLAQENLFPKTQVIDYQLDGYGMVLQHQSISPISYPYEWSFEMLKAAAVCLLRTNQIAKTYGYETKDCHPYNVLFAGTNPFFIDFGSFQPIPPKSQNWAAYEEFFGRYWYVLRLAQKTGFFISQKIVGGSSSLPHEAFLALQYPFLRQIFGLSFFQKMARRFFKFTRFTYHLDKIEKLPFGKILLFLHKNSLLPFQKTNFERLIKKIQGLKPAAQNTMWGDYHNHFYENGKIRSTPRFDRIVEILGKLPIKTVFEIAGNQGVFAKLLLERLDLDYVICSDYDEQAIDSMFRNNPNNPKLFPVLFNFRFPTFQSFTQNPEQRFRSDLVVALAVTHHLILSQKIPIEQIFEEALRYSRNYLAIEFMPLGLHDGTQGQIFPEWYSRDWFRSHFLQYCEPIAEEQLEENRIVFVGKIRRN